MTHEGTNLTDRLEKIRVYLRNCKKTQGWLARRCGISEPFMSDILNGKGTSKPVQRSISRVLRIPYEELWGSKKNGREEEGSENG